MYEYTKGKSLVGTEHYAMWRPYNIAPGAIPALLCHGAGANDTYWNALNWRGNASLGPALARAGIPAIAGEFGGSHSMANDPAMTSLDDYLAAMATNFGTDPNRCYIVGTSMGGALGLRYCETRPNKVAAMIGSLPLTNIKYVYEQNTSGLRAHVEAAWGVTYPAALPDGALLLENSALAGEIPIRFYYDESDATIPSAWVLESAAALANADVVEIPGTTGHHDNSMWTISALGGIDQEWVDVVNFLKASPV